MSEASTSQKVYTLQFFLLCLSSFLFFGSFNMMIAELPAYLTKLGGEDYKGLIISLFTLTAGLSRPISGKLTDNIGRIPVMVFGAAVCFICGFVYPFIGGVAAFLFLRFVHGLSTGFKPTATVAYVADIVPADRRGEAMGLSGISGTLGMAAGPALGSYITLNFSLDYMFYASSVMAILSVLILVGMKETLPIASRRPFHPRLLSISKSEIIEPRVFAPSLVMLLTYYSFGVIMTIIPDLTVHLGAENKGIFFTVFTLSSLLVRLVAGKMSDRFGRVVLLKVSTTVLTIAMLFIGWSHNITELLIGSALFGIAAGINSPIIFAWAVDLCKAEHRGRAIATLFIAMELAIGLGALIGAWIFDNRPEMFSYAFWSGGILSLGAFLYLWLGVRNKPVKVLY
ncbi:MFS transporter [Xanthovirga aplysinae]|uniref:MFS transporter n=1 Tax=Xanthovirga aplysinae TaxID=2529853 RepID=UPI0012BC5BF6|nr:MFS transporter [Xanthovirga aplysinae]MTI33126.1 MFS transporter [Xanthovirga aplysinae]